MRTIIGLAVLLILFGGLIWGIMRYRSSPNSPFRNEYEGRIVEKWAGYSESELGSRPYFRLLVENDDKVRFAVAVTSEIYERAEAGMRVKKTEDGIELLSDESKIIPIGK